jgi:hypothetical protein
MHPRPSSLVPDPYGRAVSRNWPAHCHATSHFTPPFSDVFLARFGGPRAPRVSWRARVGIKSGKLRLLWTGWLAWFGPMVRRAGRLAPTTHLSV